MHKKFKSLFMLDPGIIYLNHGSYGACPKPVFDALVKYQKQLEFEPVKHFAYDIYQYLENSRRSLSDYINCHMDDIVFSPNPSTALNTVIRSLDLKEGDEILSTDHEYGALDKTWKFICKKRGAKYIQQTIPLPLNSKEEFIEHFCKGLTDKTKIIFISHITSPTALIFPVKEICEIAKNREIISIVDGAHAPAQINLDLKDVNSDIYVGACHKWMCSPKGVSFLHVKKELLDYHQWQGTKDMSAFITVPDTINFLNKHNWKNVTKRCHDINLWAREQINNTLKKEPIASDEFISQMSSIFYDIKGDVFDFNIKFYLKYKIQIPFITWNDKTFLRISIQAYNSKEDILKLLEALDDLEH